MAAEKSILKLVCEKTLISILSEFKFSNKDTNSYFGPCETSMMGTFPKETSQLKVQQTPS